MPCNQKFSIQRQQTVRRLAGNANSIMNHNADSKVNGHPRLLQNLYKMLNEISKSALICITSRPTASFHYFYSQTTVSRPIIELGGMKGFYSLVDSRPFWKAALLGTVFLARNLEFLA